ncbi:MAG TPA: 4Fe-4S ferredoxin [Clostridia bacterium]|nr:4Fe-4S ferredoxin [Clostridia bacterium]
MHAVRNIRLCTKDCLCLYVCPSGATDTEDGQIDAGKCISGCRLCVDACPSHAISLVPEEFPKPQDKSDTSIGVLMEMLKSKSEQSLIASAISEGTDDPVLRQLASALTMSNRLMAEDIIREAGFMLPQGESVKKLLMELKKDQDVPCDVIDRLLELL